MSNLTKTINFNSKEELDQWLKENEGKTNFVVRNAAGEKIKEGRAGNNVVGDILWDTLVTPLAVTGLGVSDFLAKNLGRLGVDTREWQEANKRFASTSLPTSILQAYEKDPLGTWGWNFLDSALTFVPIVGQLGKGAKVVSGISKLANFADKVKDVGTATKGVSTVSNIANKFPKGTGLLGNAAAGVVSYNASEAPEDRTLEGYLMSAGLGAAIPWAIGKLPVRGLGGRPAEAPAGKTTLGVVTEPPVDRLAKTFAEKIKAGGEDLKIRVNPTTGLPETTGGLGGVLLKTFATRENFKDLTPKADALYRLAAMEKAYDIASKELGARLGLSRANEDVIINALNKARDIVLGEVGDKKKLTPGKLLEELTSFVDKEALYKKYVKELQKLIPKERVEAVLPKTWQEFVQQFPEEAAMLERRSIVDALNKMPLAKTPAADSYNVVKLLEKNSPISAEDFFRTVYELERVLGKKAARLSPEYETAKKVVRALRRLDPQSDVVTPEQIRKSLGFLINPEVLLNKRLEQMALKPQKPAQPKPDIPTSWDDLVAKNPTKAQELLLEGLDKQLGKLVHAKVGGTSVNNLWSAVKANKPVTLTQLNDAIKELNEVAMRGDIKTAQKLVAEKVKDLLVKYREELLPGLREWDRLWSGVTGFVGNKRGGLEQRSYNFLGTPITALVSAGKVLTEPTYNALQAVSSFVDKVKNIGTGGAPQQGFLRELAKDIARPMARDIPVYMDNQADKNASIDGAMGVGGKDIKMAMDMSEQKIEEVANRQIEEAYQQRRKELEALRLSLFQEALRRGQTVGNAAKYADYVVGNELKNLENATKKARLTVEEQKQKVRAHLGMEGVKTLKELAKDPATVNWITFVSAVTPGWLNIARPPEVQLFEQATLQISEAMSRALSGAAIKEDEMQRFLRMVPRFGDTKEVLDYKLKSLESFFKETLPEIERRRLQQLESGDLPADLDTLLENRDIILDSIK